MKHFLTILVTVFVLVMSFLSFVFYLIRTVMDHYGPSK